MITIDMITVDQATMELRSLGQHRYIRQRFEALYQTDALLADSIKKISTFCDTEFKSVQLCALIVLQCLESEYQAKGLSLPKVSPEAFKLYEKEIKAESSDSSYISISFTRLSEENPHVSMMLISLGLTSLGPTTGHCPTLGATGGILVYRLFEIQEELNSHRN